MTLLSLLPPLFQFCIVAAIIITGCFLFCTGIRRLLEKFTR